MSYVAMSVVWGMGWFWGVQELPFVDVGEVPSGHLVAPKGAGRGKIALRTWLLSIDKQLNAGRGDGRISKGEFVLARSLPRWRQLQRWETFGEFAAFISRSITIGRCHQKARGVNAGCSPWPRLPKIFPTMRGLTQNKKVRRHYAYSRYERICREIASAGAQRRGASRRYTRTLRRARQRQQRFQALLAFVRSLPQFKRKERWLQYLKQQWRQPAFRKRLKQALGFMPTKAQLMAVLRLIRQGKRPGVGDMLRLTKMVMQTPLRSVLAPNMLSGWRIWAGDQRSHRTRMKDWRAFLRRAPTSCQAPLQRMIQRGFLCGTTLRGAFALLSKSPLLNHFVRGLIRPFGATTFDEGLKSCVLIRMGSWMTHGNGEKCLSSAQKTRLFQLLARESMFRYEPYGSARSRALGAMLQWRPLQSIACVLRALHPRREPKRYVRDAALRGIALLLKHPQVSRRQKRVLRKFLLHSADRSFEPAVYARAAHIAMQHGDRRVLPHVLKRLYIRPHGCRLSFWGKRGRKPLLRPTAFFIPPTYWSVLAGPLVVGRVSRLPKQTRRTLYQLVQCGGAPLAYVQQAMRSLQPRHEPDPSLRALLWRSLLWRFLHFYRSRTPQSETHRATPYLWKVIRSRRKGQSAMWLLQRLLLVHLEQIGLNSSVETAPQVRAIAMLTAAGLLHPYGLTLLRRARQQGIRWPASVKRALSQRLALWPYADDMRISQLQTKDPKLVYRPLHRWHLKHVPGSQKASFVAFYRWWLAQVKDPSMRRQIKRIVKLFAQS